MHNTSPNMKHNKIIIGERVLLVPYYPVHVPTYNKWMKDPFLLEMTASEPLTIEQEYQMQQQWVEDPNKCIFIILNKNMCHDINISNTIDFLSKNVHAMIGDVNLFQSLTEDDDESCTNQAELDIMIAETQARRKGYATEAVLYMMLHGVDELGIQRYFVKIREENHESLTFFQKLGFSQCNYVPCFKELELEFKLETRDTIMVKIQNIGVQRD